MDNDKVDWNDSEQVRAYKNQKSREWYERNKETARKQKLAAANLRRANDPDHVRELDRQAKERARRRNGAEVRKVWQIDDAGRECAYEGEGNCGHTYKMWSEFNSGSGPKGKRNQCKACHSRSARDAAQHMSDEQKSRRSVRQGEYQKTPAGKEVSRRTRQKSRYGITDEDRAVLTAMFDGACHFCQNPESVPHHATGEIMRLAVDHDHGCVQGHVTTDACKHCIRGLLCYNCNRFLGRAERSPLATSATFVDYLSRRPLLSTIE
jgi:hypothetical protein